MIYRIQKYSMYIEIYNEVQNLEQCSKSMNFHLSFV